MSKHEDRVRLQHMLDASEKAQAFIRGRSRADLDQDEVFQFENVENVRTCLARSFQHSAVVYTGTLPDNVVVVL